MDKILSKCFTYKISFKIHPDFGGRNYLYLYFTNGETEAERKLS